MYHKVGILDPRKRFRFIARVYRSPRVPHRGSREMQFGSIIGQILLNPGGGFASYLSCIEGRKVLTREGRAVSRLSSIGVWL